MPFRLLAHLFTSCFLWQRMTTNPAFHDTGIVQIVESACRQRHSTSMCLYSMNYSPQKQNLLRLQGQMLCMHCSLHLLNQRKAMTCLLVERRKAAWPCLQPLHPHRAPPLLHIQILRLCALWAPQVTGSSSGPAPPYFSPTSGFLVPNTLC